MSTKVHNDNDRKIPVATVETHRRTRSTGVMAMAWWYTSWPDSLSLPWKIDSILLSLLPFSAIVHEVDD